MIERARDKSEKEQRHREIVDAAVELFEEHEYADITMVDVARGAGIAKGTVYLYFDTKGELFLEVAIRLITAWFDALDEELAALPSPVTDPEQIGSTLAATLAESRDLRRIFSILHTTIERNISVEVAADYKQNLGERLLTMSAQLEEKIETLDQVSATRLLLWLYSFIVGLDQLANPPQPIDDAVEDRDIALFDIDFEAELAAATAAWLRGI